MHYTKLFEALVALGLIAIAILIYKKGHKKGLVWTNYFSFGVLVLAIGHLLKALPSIPLSYPVDAPARYTGLIIILYAMLREVEHPKIDLLTALGILNGLAYNEGVLLFNVLGKSYLALLLIAPQYLFLVIGPLIGALILLDVYKDSRDVLAFVFAIGFIVYAIANAILITSTYFIPTLLTFYYLLMLATLGVGIIIGILI